MPTPTNQAFLALQRRAEQGDPELLVQTFVDVGPLFTILSSTDHQVIYGRRGTGKTHALNFLRAKTNEAGDLSVLIDLRTIGSSGGLYGDPKLSLAERGTRLVSDLMTHVIEQITDYVVAQSYDGFNMSRAMALLDKLDDAAVDVRISGQTTVEAEQSDSQQVNVNASAKVGLSAKGPVIESNLRAGAQNTATGRGLRRVEGVETHHVHFGQVSKVLTQLIEALPANRLWLLLDEWVAVPTDLQPLLGDLLRRALLAVPGLTVKIAAIEQRATFRTNLADGDYVGLELGGDVQADVDLDDFMVFDNDKEKAKEFFRELLFRHVSAIMEGGETLPPKSASDLQRSAFTQRNAFDDFVRAAEGVPRDAINVLRLAAQRAGDNPISVEHVRVAARRWYLSDKEKDVPDNAKSLLHWITDKVIGERKARAFLLLQSSRNEPLIGGLYDSRVLHVSRRGVAAQDRPGERFDVYTLDYGCYVELTNTAKAPAGLFQVDLAEGPEDDEGAWVEVPQTDYRSIRRAILDLAEFGQRDDDVEQLTLEPRRGEVI